MSDENKSLSERLRERAIGRHEWRVQDPNTGAYCIAYSRNDGYSIDPEREARAWLADHQQQFPRSSKAGYVVACVNVQTCDQQLMEEAADLLESLQSQSVDSLLAVNAAQAEEIERQRHVIRQLELLVKRLETT